MIGHQCILPPATDELSCLHVLFGAQGMMRWPRCAHCGCGTSPRTCRWRRQWTQTGVKVVVSMGPGGWLDNAAPKRLATENHAPNARVPGSRKPRTDFREERITIKQHWVPSPRPPKQAGVAADAHAGRGCGLIVGGSVAARPRRRAHRVCDAGQLGAGAAGEGQGGRGTERCAAERTAEWNALKWVALVALVKPGMQP